MNSDSFDFYESSSLKSHNLDESMRYQLSVLDSLDVFTRKHCENVANLTCRLCERLHLNRNFVVYCTICAYLHDIGKQHIPPEILQKPGKLTDEEYNIMKTHTTIGYEICMRDLKLRDYAAGPIYHHEALNGSGYPNGLSKNEIPLEGQIIRVADEFDAIVSKRQYKSHIGISDTLKILIENANNGKNNSKVVNKLIKIIIEDTEYEIYRTQGYVTDLQNNITRLSTIDEYVSAFNQETNPANKRYYQDMIQHSLRNGENMENYKTLQKEYEKAYSDRKAIIDNLYNEIKIMKKLKA